MSTIYFLVIWRAYLIILAIMLLNVASSLLFKPNKKTATQAINRVPFAIVWPVSIFSKTGRKKLFNTVKDF